MAGRFIAQVLPIQDDNAEVRYALIPTNASGSSTKVEIEEFYQGDNQTLQDHVLIGGVWWQTSTE